jgi:RNA polymerase sigma-70 factor (ECF subfamily)
MCSYFVYFVDMARVAFDILGAADVILMDSIIMMPDQDDLLLNDFERHRSVLFALAYRMLGSVMDADDIVQEAFLRWQEAPTSQVEAPKAYLQRIVTRLCIDHLRSARVRRELYVGPWLPEPLIQSEDVDPAAAADLADSLSLGFLRLLERLTPLERAVFLLHDVFGYTYEEVAQVVGKSAVHCRQLGHRARAWLVAERPRFPATPAQVDQITRQFIHTCSDGDMQGLLALFAADITLWPDGGGKPGAMRNPIVGADRVTRFLLGVRRKVPFPSVLQPVRMNGQPGILWLIAGRLMCAMALELDRGAIRAIYWVYNPDKLQAIQQWSVGDEVD